ncbi:TPA: ATP-binding protein [Campylobacter jejuni]|nr:ATP-binding protein [Campylobacter jejuni]
MEKIKKICDIHNIEYEAKFIKFINSYSMCPKCAEDREQEKEEKEKREAYIKKCKEQEFLRNYIISNSNIPLRYIDFVINKDNKNIKPFLKYLDLPLEKNLFIIGDTGAGKTLFLSKVLIKNADKFPIYLNGNELVLLNENNFKIVDLLNKIDGKGIIAIDEVQMLIFGQKTLIMDYIIDKAYNQQSKIILCGNLTKQGLEALKNREWKRISSRIKQDGVSILDFGDKDLR